MPISKNLLDQIKENNYELKIINLSSQYPVLSEEDIKLLVDTISKNDYITTLNLTDNEIGDFNLRFFSQLKGIKNLSLANNQITDEGVEFLSKMEKLEVLDLSQNEITDKGLRAILSMPNLRELYLNSNNVSNNSLNIILKNNSLTVLFIENNELDKDLFSKISSHIQKNKLNADYLNSKKVSLADANLSKSLSLTGGSPVYGAVIEQGELQLSLFSNLIGEINKTDTESLTKILKKYCPEAVNKAYNEMQTPVHVVKRTKI